MRKSERLRQLELTVVRMEMTLELLTLAINNIMESQEMVMEENNALDILRADLESGKWYKTNTETP